MFGVLVPKIEHCPFLQQFGSVIDKFMNKAGYNNVADRYN